MPYSCVLDVYLEAYPPQDTDSTHFKGRSVAGRFVRYSNPLKNYGSITAKWHHKSFAPYHIVKSAVLFRRIFTSLNLSQFS